MKWLILGFKFLFVWRRKVGRFLFLFSVFYFFLPKACVGSNTYKPWFRWKNHFKVHGTTIMVECIIYRTGFFFGQQVSCFTTCQHIYSGIQWKKFLYLVYLVLGQWGEKGDSWYKILSLLLWKYSFSLCPLPILLLTFGMLKDTVLQQFYNFLFV